ncbi:DMT family transporter [Litoribrevibacter albus]|uniref:Multidrug transporter n=1 Tax=Litoribrevibacter albus TaxID=1473156 RepID=A0AA37W729_9GAMM|nr:DMT family transporter [Litoribrevibacter albus]GLQ30704.1 multidrug transporter [Litoribrevibacter albus]
MTWLPFLLVVVSAFCHAAWNFIGKKSVPYMSFFTVVSSFAALMLLPFALYYHQISTTIVTDHFGMLVLTGCFQAFYLFGLSQGYRGYELSVVYPLARALPVALVPIAVSVFSHKHYNLIQYVGVFLIIIGCLLIPFKGKDVFWSSLKSPGVFFAMVAALATTGYSYVDQTVLTGLSQSLPDHQGWQRSLVYMFWLSLSSAIWCLGFSFISRSSAEQWRSTVTQQMLSTASTAFVMTLTYSLVLIAMNYTEHVGQVVALRQVSIPIGVAMGVWLLNEEFNRLKLLGLVSLMVGIYLVL